MPTKLVKITSFFQLLGKKYSEDLEGMSYYAAAMVKKSSSFSNNELKVKMYTFAYTHKIRLM